MSRRAFFFHYHKPASLKAGETRWSLHYKGACHIVKHIICDVTIQSHARKTQPKAVMKGTCNGVLIQHDVALVY
jgi:hypothetical protein